METNTSFFGSIVGFFTTGGFWMLPIFGAQIVSLAIIANASCVCIYNVSRTYVGKPSASKPILRRAIWTASSCRPAPSVATRPSVT